MVLAVGDFRNGGEGTVFERFEVICAAVSVHQRAGIGTELNSDDERVFGDVVDGGRGCEVEIGFTFGSHDQLPDVPLFFSCEGLCVDGIVGRLRQAVEGGGFDGRVVLCLDTLHRTVLEFVELAGFAYGIDVSFRIFLCGDVHRDGGLRCRCEFYADAEFLFDG